MEEETDRWGKPHVASLSFRSLLELRKTLSHGRAGGQPLRAQAGVALAPLASAPSPLPQAPCSSTWTRRLCRGWLTRWWSRWSSPTRSGPRTAPTCCGRCCSSTGEQGTATRQRPTPLGSAPHGRGDSTVPGATGPCRDAGNSPGAVSASSPSGTRSCRAAADSPGFVPQPPERREGLLLPPQHLGRQPGLAARAPPQHQPRGRGQRAGRHRAPHRRPRRGARHADRRGAGGEPSTTTALCPQPPPRLPLSCCRSSSSGRALA